MRQGEALTPAPGPCLHEADWWLAAPVLVRAITQQDRPRQASACYRLGDAVLQVTVDDPALLDAFEQLYGDCAVCPPGALEGSRVRCTIRRGGRPPLLLVTFEAGAPPDPAAAAFSLLRPTRAVPPYTVYDSPLAGWRLAGGATQPLLAACDAHVLIDPQQVSSDFLVEYLVGITLAAQPALLPVHGASLCLGQEGVLLTGASHAGKTTTALSLAGRGYTLLGDEVALIRLATNEMVPLRRTVNVRPGPHAAALANVLGLQAVSATSHLSERWESPQRISALFPALPAHTSRLRAAFFLHGFAETPSLVPYRLTLADGEIFNWLATPEIAYNSWGLAPGQRTFRLLTLRQVFSRIPCWLLRLGTPNETVDLIKRTMEELAC